MSPLEKTIFVADFTSLDRIIPISMKCDVAPNSKRACHEYAFHTIRELLNKSAVILPDAIDAYNEIIALKQKESNTYAATKSSQSSSVVLSVKTRRMSTKQK